MREWQAGCEKGFSHQHGKGFSHQHTHAGCETGFSHQHTARLGSMQLDRAFSKKQEAGPKAGFAAEEEGGLATYFNP